MALNDPKSLTPPLVSGEPNPQGPSVVAELLGGGNYMGGGKDAVEPLPNPHITENDSAPHPKPIADHGYGGKGGLDPSNVQTQRITNWDWPASVKSEAHPDPAPMGILTDD